MNGVKTALKVIRVIDDETPATLEAVADAAGITRMTLWRVIRAVREDFGVEIDRDDDGRPRVNDWGIVDRKRFREQAKA